jgi:hypothetical protein
MRTAASEGLPLWWSSVLVTRPMGECAAVIDWVPQPVDFIAVERAAVLL